MFQRIVHEDWHAIFPVVAFVVAFAVFAAVVIRVIRMPRDRERHMAGLPLQPDDHANPHG